MARPVVPLVLGLAGVLTLGLCGWQVGRDGERNVGRELALAAAGAPTLGNADAPAPWREVDWTGAFAARPGLVAGRSHEGVRGYGLLLPFRRADGVEALVDLGWVPGAEVAARVAKEQRETRLVGLLRPLERRPDEPRGLLEGVPIWDAAAEAGAFDWVVVTGLPGGAPTPGRVDGYARVPERDNTSLHYASQWLAITVVAWFFAWRLGYRPSTR